MMHTPITATGLPEEARLALLDMENALDDLATDIQNAAHLMWMLSRHDDLSTAYAGSFSALESMTGRFAENVQTFRDTLGKIRNGEPVPRMKP